MKRTLPLLMVVLGCAPGPSATTVDTGPIDTGIDALGDSTTPFTPQTTPVTTLPTATGTVHFAHDVVDAPGAGDLPFRDPALAVNGVRGGGWFEGSLDVFALGFSPTSEASLTLGWGGGRVFDGAGPDLAVFENPFEYTEGNRFMDPVIVSVSPDGIDWVDFPHDYTAPDERAYSTSPADWSGFAGVTPVLLHVEDNVVDPFDGAAAGGDAFDLADLPADDPVSARVLQEGVLQVRVTTASARVNPHTGEEFVADPVSNGADIDGVAGRYLLFDIE